MEGNGKLAERIPTRLTAAQGRKFGLTVGIAFLVLAGIALWRDGQTVAKVLASLGGALVLAGLLIPTMLGPVERGWMKLAHLISKVTQPIILGLLYLLVFTPVALIMKIVGKQPLKHGNKSTGFWIERAPDARRSNLLRQF
jgi:hypothetical protein